MLVCYHNVFMYSILKPLLQILLYLTDTINKIDLVRPIASFYSSIFSKLVYLSFNLPDILYITKYILNEL